MYDRSQLEANTNNAAELGLAHMTYHLGCGAAADTNGRTEGSCKLFLLWAPPTLKPVLVRF